MSPKFPSGWTKGDKSIYFDEIGYCYFTYTLFFLIIFVYVTQRSIRILWREYKSSYVDRFRVIQMVFIICYVFTRSIYTLIWYFRWNGLEYYHIGSIAINTFFFYYFLVINNVWWLNFIIHLRVAEVAGDLNRKVLKKIWLKEVILFLIWFISAVILLFAPLILMIFSLVNTWHHNDFFSEEDFTPSIWEGLYNAFYTYTIVLSLIGFVSGILKLIIGFFMLRIMKK